MKTLIVHAIEKELGSPDLAAGKKRVTFPLVRLPKGKKLNLEGFNFDDLLA